MQEITYPQFCEVLVRIAASRLSAVAGVEKRVRRLICDFLMPLTRAPTQSPAKDLLQSAALAQYVQGIAPLLKFVFCTIARKAPVRHGACPTLSVLKARVLGVCQQAASIGRA